MTKEIIQSIKDLIQERFTTDATGHDYHHIFRVQEMAKHLQSSEGGDLMLIEAAALLHDISDHKFNGGKLDEGGNVAEQLCIDFGCTPEFAQEVKQIVNSVSFKGANVKDGATTIEAQIVQDADRLDAIGAIGIARAFAYGGNANRPIYTPDLAPKLHSTFEEYANAKSHTINHFYEKLLLLKDRLHTQKAKEIGEKRTTLMQQFLEEFYSEWNFNTHHE